MRQFALILLMVLGASAWAEDTTLNGYLLASVCSRRLVQKGQSGSGHTRQCLQICQDGGYGILTSDHKFMKFDYPGDAKVRSMLKNMGRENDIKISVTGAIQGDTIAVSRLELSQ